MVWKGTETEFMDELNDNDRNIRLAFGFDLVSIPFLDLRIAKKDGILVTSTFHKPMVANTTSGRQLSS